MEYVEVARAESERGELVLRERRDAGGPAALELRANGVFVMDTVETTTEVVLATAALALVAEPADVLIGGLGLGFTLQTVAGSPEVERVTVIEIEEALVGWMRDGTIPHGRALLADERVRVVVADIATAVVEARPASFDLILLDVDNGPGYLVHAANAALYQEAFLARVRDVLRPGGALAVWSAAEAPDLAATLGSVFGDAVVQPHAVDLQGRDEAYWLYAARKAALSGVASLG